MKMGYRIGETVQRSGDFQTDSVNYKLYKGE